MPQSAPPSKPNAHPSEVTAVGFEPTPFRNGALSHRLRPLGQTVIGFSGFNPNLFFLGYPPGAPGSALGWEPEGEGRTAWD